MVEKAGVSPYFTAPNSTVHTQAGVAGLRAESRTTGEHAGYQVKALLFNESKS